MKANLSRSLRPLSLAFVLGLAATCAGAVPRDGFRLGVQLLGQNLAGVTTEWVFAQNGAGLEAGIFDALDEPVLTAFYRRYIEIPSWAAVGLAPSVGADLICMASLPSLGSSQPAVFGMLGVTLALDWTFLERFSLCSELRGFVGRSLTQAGPWQPAFSPSVAVRIAF
jgi:hypothetical protein